MEMQERRHTRWAAIAFLLLAFIASMAIPLSAHAQEPEEKVVRVGWFDSSFCYRDQFGRRCGIDYEYQCKISAYTGWTYEYVEDSWPNLLQMLRRGEIDLLSDVSYTPERAEFMLFADLPMGSESYYIYVDADNRAITTDNMASFNGARIGVNQNSVQEGFLKDWSERNHIDLEIIPMAAEEDESMEMVERGELDGYASIFSFSSEQKVVPVCRIGSSEYYYAVSENRPDLLSELNMALAGIQDEDPTFNQRLTEERLFNTRTNAFLTPLQEDWIAEHGEIRIGYCENFLPFCQTDPETGELTGALKDYLAHTENNLRNSNVTFKAMPFTTVDEALRALKAGEVDCVFPVDLSSYDASEMGIRLTNPAMKTGMNAVRRVSDNRDLSRDSTTAFAVNASDPNTRTFIMDEYPASSMETYPSDEACYDAVASDKADCVLVSNYRIPSVEDAIKARNLFSVPTGESMPLSFAVNKENKALYFLLNKTVLMTESGDMDAALASYMRSNQKVSFMQFLKDNLIAVIIALLVVFAVIVVLLLQRLKAERKANEQQKMMEEGLRRELRQQEQLQSAMKMAYTDPLTGVKSKHAYNEAEEDMDQRIAEGAVSEFSVVVFDLNDLKVVNDSRGHEVGDEYIKDACKLICTCFKHSPVFRVGGDEFVAILEEEDYANQEELLERFEKQVLENLGRDKTVVAFGCARFDPRQDKSTRMVFERADASMYGKKELLKSLGTETGDEKSGKTGRVFASEDISRMNVRKHILIADDVESSREILGDLLRDDYDILYAADGVEAMEMLRSHKHEIAIVLLDLYMPNMTGREVMTQMQVDDDLRYVPVIVLSVDQHAELDCLNIGAMDFIPKPYPDIEIIKARISKCIELSENRDLIRRTQRDRLTGLFNFDYFIRYVGRFDLHYRESAFDAVVCFVSQFHSINEQYGRQFGDLVLRSVGLGMGNLARKTNGIGCREEGDTFLLYCPHRDDYDRLLEKFLADLFLDEETANRVTLKFGIFTNAQQEPDVEERFVRAKSAAKSIEDDPRKSYKFYDFK